MFTFFNATSLWIGYDMERFNQIREQLDKAEIVYKHKVRNRLGQWNGKGTTRGTRGSLGTPSERMYEYEIFVYNKELEQAKYVMNKE